MGEHMNSQIYEWAHLSFLLPNTTHDDVTLDRHTKLSYINIISKSLKSQAIIIALHVYCVCLTEYTMFTNQNTQCLLIRTLNMHNYVKLV